MAAIFRHLFETDHRLLTGRRDLSRDPDNLATTHSNLSIARRRLNMSLAHLLEYMWDMARNERFGVGPAMLFVIVRAPRPDQLLSLKLTRCTQDTRPEDLVSPTVQLLSPNHACPL